MIDRLYRRGRFLGLATTAAILNACGGGGSADSSSCEKLAEIYIGGYFETGALENWFAYVMALVFLLFRPQGLFGDKIIERV